MNNLEKGFCQLGWHGLPAENTGSSDPLFPVCPGPEALLGGGGWDPAHPTPTPVQAAARVPGSSGQHP